MSLATSTAQLKEAAAPAKSPPWLFARASEAMLSQVLRRAIRFLFLFLCARNLGPEVFGSYALLLAMLETLSLITGEGLTDYVAREVSKSPSVARSLCNRVSILRCLFAIPLAPMAIAILHLLHYPAEVERNAAWFFLVLLARGPLASAQGLFRAVHRMRLLVWLEAVQGATLLAIGWYFVAHELSLRAVIWAELGSAFSGALAAILMARNVWSLGGGRSLPWSTIWNATATFNVFPLITNIYDRIDIVILSVIAGNAAAGFYALPYRVLATLQIIPFGLMAAALPILSGRAPSSNDKQMCLRMTTLLGVLSMFPALILTLLAGPLVFLVLGESYAASIGILRVLVWAAIPMFLNYGLNTFLLARDREQVFLRTNSICAAANITLNLLFIPRFSFYAAAAVTIVTECLLLAQNLVIIRRKFDFVALPNRLWTSMLILAAVVVGAQAANGHVSPLVAAAVACCVFAFWLYFNGSLKGILETAGPSKMSAQ
jgi:O-antigen/teichoic acid export membrane protein